jgi:hypothetical protein
MASRLLQTRAEEDPTFWVITSYFNGKGDERRLRCFRKFAQALRRQRVKLCVVEVGATLPVDACDLISLHVRLCPEDTEIWCKEALLNIALKRLPPECSKVCWMDADIEFRDPRWANKCSELLNTHRVVQPHTAFVFMEEGEEPEPKVDERRYHPSFVAEAKRRNQGINRRPINFHKFHPGHAWAARRADLDAVGGFFPWCILGHGDIVMATGFYGHRATMLHLWDRKSVLGVYTKHWSPALKLRAQRWQAEAQKVFQGNIGAPDTPTIAFHHWHGSAESRKYGERGKLLSDYSPHRDTLILESGVLAWSDNAPAPLRESVDRYFAERATAA